MDTVKRRTKNKMPRKILTPLQRGAKLRRSRELCSATFSCAQNLNKTRKKSSKSLLASELWCFAVRSVGLFWNDCCNTNAQMISSRVSRHFWSSVKTGDVTTASTRAVQRREDLRHGKNILRFEERDKCREKLGSLLRLKRARFPCAKQLESWNELRRCI